MREASYMPSTLELSWSEYDEPLFWEGGER